MNYSIEFLKPGDEAKLIAGVNLTGEGPITEAQAERALADTSMVNVAAIVETQVVGFIYGYVLDRFETTSLLIYLVDVDELFQRHGIALAMLKALKERGRRGAWREMFVFTNASNNPAMALYAKAGGLRPNSDDVMFDFICD